MFIFPKNPGNEKSIIFCKCLPDGAGTYIWQTGEIYKGEWNKRLRESKGELAPYVIGYRSNVGRVTFMKTGDEKNFVKYKFSRSGGESATFMTISDLTMQGSSGTENISFNFTGFEDVTFPFEGKVKFTAPNATITANLDCEVRLTINEPGQWLVTIFY